MKPSRFCILLSLLCFAPSVTACSEDDKVAKDDVIEVVQLADNFSHPWSLEFLPIGDMLVTERSGKLFLIAKNGKSRTEISGVPKVFAEGQGGLLDVTIDPNFRENRYIYISYAEAEDKKAGTAVARAKLIDNSLQDLEVIFRQQPKTDGSNHFGSRLVFAPDGKLFITLGERFDYMDEAQNIENHLGALVRINSDGTIPNDNPFVNKEGADEIWSYGHRNMQGAAINPETGELWIHEHGPRGGDEINIPKAGKNYGWPEASYGIHYWMIPIEDEHKEQGFEEPIYYWDPSIAPSGMMFYKGNKFPNWKGNLFVGALAEKHLARVELKGESVVAEEKLLTNKGYRIRDVAQDNEGYILC